MGFRGGANKHTSEGDVNQAEGEKFLFATTRQDASHPTQYCHEHLSTWEKPKTTTEKSHLA